MEQHSWTDGSWIVVFVSRNHRQFVRRPPNTEFKLQNNEDSEARWRKHHDMGMRSGLFITYQGHGSVWIQTFAKEEMFLNGCFNKTTAPNTPGSSSILVPGQPDSCYGAAGPNLDLDPVENWWGDIRNAVSQEKPRTAEELWTEVQWCWTGIPDHRWQKLVDSMNTDVEQFSETEVLQLNVSSQIHRTDQSESIPFSSLSVE